MATTARRTYVTQTVDQGDGTIAIYALSPLYNAVSIVIGRDLLNSAAMWSMLDVAATKADDRARALGQQIATDGKD